MKKILSIILTATMISSSFCAFAEETNNKDSNGGAIYNQGGEISIDNEINISDNNNQVNNGGAIYNQGGEISIDNEINLSDNNNQGNNGGAIYNQGGEISIDNEINISDNNIQSGNGGAIYNQGSLGFILDGEDSNSEADKSDAYKAPIFKTTNPIISNIADSVIDAVTSQDSPINEIVESVQNKLQTESGSEIIQGAKNDIISIIDTDSREKLLEDIKNANGNPEELLNKLKNLYATASSDFKALILKEIANVKATMNDNNISVFIKGLDIDFSKYNNVYPMIKDGRTIIPVRAIMESFGAEVNWDDATKTVTVSKDKITIKMQIGSKKININGKDINIDVAPEIINGRTMIPIRAIAEAFGLNVNWDENSRSVIID